MAQEGRSLPASLTPTGVKGVFLLTYQEKGILYSARFRARKEGKKHITGWIGKDEKEIVTFDRARNTVRM